MFILTNEVSQPPHISNSLWTIIGAFLAIYIVFILYVQFIIRVSSALFLLIRLKTILLLLFVAMSSTLMISACASYMLTSMFSKVVSYKIKHKCNKMKIYQLWGSDETHCKSTQGTTHRLQLITYSPTMTVPHNRTCSSPYYQSQLLYNETLFSHGQDFSPLLPIGG